MIVVALAVWIGSSLILAGWFYWLTARAQADRNALEELIDRVDQILATPARPKPAPGPATVPTGVAIDVWAHSIGKHAAKGMK